MSEKKQKKYVCDLPSLMNEWDWEKNKDILPSQLTIGSNKKVWWIGNCGHSWPARVKERSRGRKCPVCTGKYIVKGINDLETTHPELIKEWDFEENAPLLPSSITANSHTPVTWRCEKGHKWKVSPNHRVSKGRGCRYCCHNPQVLVGENDFATLYPGLAAEWHPTMNGSLLPNQFTANSSKRVWWMCTKGHEWPTSISHRANGSGCPYCKNAQQTSFPEQAIYYYVKAAYPEAINGYIEIFKNHGMELDIYIPSLKIGIEYDGYAFHRTVVQHNREVKKYRICKELGIMLVRIREKPLEASDDICDESTIVTDSLTSTIKELKKFLPHLSNIDINVERDETIIKTKYYSEQEKNSLQYLHPILCQEWNYEKNNGLTPNMFSAHSNDKVWWKCSNNHEWPASIDSRVSGNGCPYCCNRLVWPGYNDLASKRPDLVKEWNYSKNIYSPSSVLPGSGNYAWWICSECGHQWRAEISSRNKGANCPECAKKSRIKTRMKSLVAKRGSLADHNPKLASEWHPTKNGILLPTDFTQYSKEKVWWLCPICGHEWPAIIQNRNNGSGCEKCSRKKREPISYK